MSHSKCLGMSCLGNSDNLALKTSLGLLWLSKNAHAAGVEILIYVICIAVDGLWPSCMSTRSATGAMEQCLTVLLMVRELNQSIA